MALTDVMNGLHLAQTLPEVAVAGLTHDSRKVEDGYAFMALPGAHVQGTDFVEQAISNGASVAVGPSWPDAANSSIPYIMVDNPNLAYSRMAANFYGHPSSDLKIVGITGTNGKTTTAELVSSMMNAADIKSATLGTLGARSTGKTEATGYTTPDPATLQRVLAEVRDTGHQAVVMEVSSHALAQHRTDDVNVDVAVFTNLTQDHLDYHGSMDAYLEAKQRLFAMLKPDATAILNADDPSSKYISGVVSGTVLQYGLSDGTDLQVVELGMNLERTVATVAYGDQSLDIESSLIGSYNLSNILAATLTGLALDLPAAAIVGGIAKIGSVSGRLERIASGSAGQVMIDYAHTPDAFVNVLGTLRQLALSGTRITVLFGCGGDRDRTKRPLMAQAAETYADHVIVTSDNPRTESLDQIMADTIGGFSQQKHTLIPDRAEALESALSVMTDDSLLLVLGKGRETYEIIGTEKVPHNDIDIIENYKS